VSRSKHSLIFTPMNDAELILNPDGSVYHLNLLPEDLAPTIILVGDKDRVPLVSQHFDRIDIKKQKREFITHTGWIGNKRITVLSTGIGSPNIDIVMNELDALVNIDLSNRHVHSNLSSLNFIRIGTSGSIHPDIDVDQIVISTMAVGTDNLGDYYQSKKINHPLLPSWSYITERYPFDLKKFTPAYTEGITLTCSGFYAPQGRTLRIAPAYTIPINGLHLEKINGFSFTNLEMETAAIYLMATLLGHRAISVNAILGNRWHGNFSQDPQKTISDLIRHTLDWIAQLPE